MSRIVARPLAAPQPSQVQPTVSTAVVQEADGTVQFVVNRTGDTRGSAVVQYATEDGTALAGEDYLATSGSLIFGDVTAIVTRAVSQRPWTSRRRYRTL